jgi:UDP-N-acetylglucosamine--N-acetylmuramyl-(pentapeptide) pyrophosphoryl-undecaprenol N-acetylglucosamine transferase
MAEIYDQSDLVIACPGAMTLAEIAAAGLPSLLVPLSGAAEQHQHLNARAFSARTGATWVTEEDWDTTREAARLAALARDPGELSRLGARAQTWGRPCAAQELVRLCEELLRP